MFLFRFPPILYFILAPIALAFGIWGYFDGEATEAEKAKALAAKPPAEVLLENYDSSKPKGAYDEVVVLAQADYTNMSEVTTTRKGVETGRTLFVRLYPTTAKDQNTPATALMASHDNMTDEELNKIVVREGAFGPIIKIDGTDTGGSNYSSELTTALARGPKVVDTPVIIEPFGKGRALALQPGDGGMPLLIFGLVAALGLGIYGFIRMSWINRGREEEDAQPA